MKKTLAIFSLIIVGCVSFGPDYSDAEDHCEDRGGFYPGLAHNPIYFSCADGSKWKRASHDGYDFQGWEDRK